MSVREVSNSVSNTKISAAQRDVEQTPSEPILPPQPSGKYDVDESVRACKNGSSSITWALLIPVSFSCPRNNSCTCAELWRVIMGQNCENRCRVAFWRRGDLLPQGLHHLLRTAGATADTRLSDCYIRCHREAYVRGRVRIPESHSRCFSQLRAETICLGETRPGGP